MLIGSWAPTPPRPLPGTGPGQPADPTWTAEAKRLNAPGGAIAVVDDDGNLVALLTTKGAGF